MDDDSQKIRVVPYHRYAEWRDFHKVIIHETVNLWGKDHEIGEGTKIGAFCDIGDGVKIGKNCKIQCFVSIPPGSVIGDNVFLGPHVGIANHKRIGERENWHMAGSTIQDDVSVGMGAMIGPGIVVGKNAVVGMGAVVIKDVPANDTVIGNPARSLHTG